MNTATAKLQKTGEQSEKQRLTSEDWALAALDVIGEHGVAAVAVEPIAKRLGVTKGSFYWHFRNRNALLKEALEHWENEDIRTFERSLNIIKDPHKKMRALFQRTRKEVRSHVIFCALFMAVDNALVADVMQRVSERRIEFLRDGFIELGVNSAEAEHRARLTFMSYVGFLQYYQNFKTARLSGEQLDAYVDHMIATLIPVVGA